MKYLKDAFHWHIDIRPVAAKLTTSSWAANICINPVSPEDAAKHLREVNQAKTCASLLNISCVISASCLIELSEILLKQYSCCFGYIRR